MKKTDNWPTDLLVYWPTNILTEAVSWESGVQLDPGNMAKFYTGNILYEKKKKIPERNEKNNLKELRASLLKSFNSN